MCFCTHMPEEIKWLDILRRCDVNQRVGRTVFASTVSELNSSLPVIMLSFGQREGFTFCSRFSLQNNLTLISPMSLFRVFRLAFMLVLF